MGLDKRFLIEQLATRLKQSDEAARRAGAEAREAARSLQTESEKKEDGRAAIEFGSLATGQSARALKLQEELQQLAAFWNRGVPPFKGTSAVALGAVVDLATDDGERGPEERTFILLPVGAGTELTGPGGDGFLSVITPASPVGKALLGRRAGDYVEVTIGRETREWKLIEVS
jgi:transcription elongation GreA/GreB family factor